MASVTRYDDAGSVSCHDVVVPVSSVVSSVRWPLEMPVHGAGACTVTSYHDLSDGWSLPRYQVWGPWRCCIVRTSPVGVMVKPVVEKSCRVVGAGAGRGVPT